MMRRKLLEQADAVARGGEPMGVIRDPAQNRCVTLPIIDRERWVKGFPRAKLFSEIQKTPGPILPDGFVFQAGQPDDVRLAFRKAMGLE
jgi:5,5'-dehydrodivanillate O-demethylase